jgi:predicted AlkP superfamily phosphohydrolase/phosphomutase
MARPRRVALALALALVVTGLIACGQEQEPRGRVLLIGIDGAAPRLVDPWIEQGRLPHLAGIARAGVSGTLLSHRPLLSPRIWTSIATGKAPSKHGIHQWVHPDEKGMLRLYKSSDRQVHALWNIASEAGLTVGVVNWLTTYPPEVIEGVMISDFAVPGERKAREGLGALFAKTMSKGAQTSLPEDRSGAGTTHPARWEEHLRRLADENAAEAERENPFAEFDSHLREDFRRLLDRSYSTDRLVVRVALEVDRALHPDLLMVYLPGVDRCSHFLWGAFEPEDLYPERLRFPAAEKRAAAAALQRYYEITDRWIGELLDPFEESDLVMVMSDHGFEARFQEGLDLTGGHDSEDAAKAVFFARGAEIPAGEPAGEVSVDDITPTILAWLGLPLAEDMDGRSAPFLGVELAERVATYDTAPIARVGKTAGEVEAAIIEQLHGLGYIEE